jgi:hypothetical protein
LARIADHQVGLADVFVRAAMPRVELERAMVVAECERQVARIAVRVREKILDVGVARVAQRR